MSIMSFYAALKDNENIENDVILSLTRKVIEKETGITLAVMKKVISDSYRTVDYELIKNELPVKTIKEVSEEYNISTDAIRSYCRRNNISYKRAEKGRKLCSYTS